MLLDDAEGALWTSAMLEAARVGDAAGAGPDRGGGRPAGDRAWRRRTTAGSSWSGVMTQGPAAGLARLWCWRMPACRAASPDQTGRERRSRRWSGTGPTGWWPRSTRAATWSRAVMRQIDPLVPFRAVRAPAWQGGAGGAGGGALRAGAGDASARAGRAGGPDVPDDRAGLSTGSGSPDRVDALVWALHELMIEPAAGLAAAADARAVSAARAGRRLCRDGRAGASGAGERLEQTVRTRPRGGAGVAGRGVRADVE